MINERQTVGLQSEIARPRVKLHIDRLRLEGLGRVNKGLLERSIVSELKRLMPRSRERNGASRRVNLGEVNGGSITVGPNTSERILGESIARKIYDSLPLG